MTYGILGSMKRGGFSKDHNRVNWFVIKTDRGYYNAGIAGMDKFGEEPERLFSSMKAAADYYAKAVIRSKAWKIDLPIGVEILKIRRVK